MPMCNVNGHRAQSQWHQSMRRRSTLATLVIIGLVIAGCQASNERSAAADTAVSNARAGSLEGATKPESGGGMGSMAGMQGMQSGVTGAMMDSMRLHMRTMQSASAEQMKAMLPRHRQMVANMLARMNAEMRSMNMRADAAWSATIDSVRQDLIHLPDMSAKELERVMPAHGARVTRLIEMHQRMTNQASGKRP